MSRPPSLRWLTVPVLAFALGATVSIVQARTRPAPATDPVLVARIEREADAASWRLAVRGCATTAPGLVIEERLAGQRRLAEARAREAAEPVWAVRAEVARIADAVAVGACPSLVELTWRAMAVEDAHAVVTAVVASGELPASARAEARAALARLAAPAIDVAGLLEVERDRSLAGLAIAVRLPVLREPAVVAGHRALRDHRDASSRCAPALGLPACARALERGGARREAEALRRFADLGVMVGELADALADAGR